MLQFRLLAILVIAGAINYAYSATLTCGSCSIDDTVKVCGAASAATAYCVYKSGSDCTDATKKKALLAALKAQINCPASVTKTCQCEKTFIETEPQTCTTKEAQVNCVYKVADAGCGGAAEDYAAARKYVSGLVVSDATCKGLSATCKCEIAYYGASGDLCAAAKTFVTCVTAVNPQTDKACDGTKTAAAIKIEATAAQTAKCTVTTTPSGAGRLGYPLAAMFVTLLALFVKM